MKRKNPKKIERRNKERRKIERRKIDIKRAVVVVMNENRSGERRLRERRFVGGRKDSTSYDPYLYGVFDSDGKIGSAITGALSDF